MIASVAERASNLKSVKLVISFLLRFRESYRGKG